MLAVAGAGPVLPPVILCAVVAADGMTETSTDHILEGLDRYLVRARTATSEELIGLFHPTMAEHLTRPGPHWVDATNTRHLLIDNIDRIAPVDGRPHDTPIYRWANRNIVALLLRAGLVERAFFALLRRDLSNPKDNLENWSGLLPHLIKALGRMHHFVLIARGRIAAYTFFAGSPLEGLRLLWELLPDQKRELGAYHPDTLNTRSSIAWVTGDVGNPSEALRLSRELLPDHVRVLGADHSATLSTRNTIAAFTGYAGDPVGGAATVRGTAARSSPGCGP